MPDDPMIPWFRVDLGAPELARLARAVEGRHVTMGPLAAEMERGVARLLGVPEVVLVNSGASALLVALAACGVGPGDEVVVPGLSFIATAHAPMLLGARVRLVDVTVDRGLLDPELLEAAVTPRTRAIVPVHLNGRAVDMDAILDFARPRGIAVVEDAAQALASRDGRGRPLGTLGDAGCFSFGITKLVTTGEGGAVLCRKPGQLARCRQLRNNGSLTLSANRYDGFGLNFRPVDLLAAVGLARLERVDETRAALGRVYRFYRRGLAGLPSVRLLDVDVDVGVGADAGAETGGGELPLWIEVLCADRDRIIAGLARRGIQARAFPPALCDAAHLDGSHPLPRARRFAEQGMVLPSGPDQRTEDLERVLAALADLGPAGG